MVTDLAELRRLAESKQAENVDFRRFLTAHHVPEEPFHILAGDIQQHTDCTACGNCCRFTLVNVTAHDLDAVAQHLGMPRADVVRLYTMPDPESPSQRVLRNERDACAFLDGNICLIYEARPKACRDFPHVAPGVHTVGGRMASVCRNASFCPIIYNALEAYKNLVGYRHAA